MLPRHSASRFQIEIKVRRLFSRPNLLPSLDGPTRRELLDWLNSRLPMPGTRSRKCLSAMPDDFPRKVFSDQRINVRLGGSGRRQSLDCLTELWHRLVNHCPPHEAKACVRRGNDSPLRGQRWSFERLPAARTAKPPPWTPSSRPGPPSSRPEPPPSRPGPPPQDCAMPISQQKNAPRHNLTERVFLLQSIYPSRTIILPESRYGAA
jgi:hypothetical protein